MASKFEKLIEYIINEDEAKAKALFHQIVVEKSRDIYEGLQSAEMGGERLGNEINGHKQGIEGDEFGMHEAEDEPGDEFGGDAIGTDDGMGDEFSGDDMGGDDEFGGDDMGGEEMGMGGEEAPIEDRVMDLEDAIDELKAEFDALMAGEEGEDHEGIEGDEDDMFNPEDDEESDMDSEEGTSELGDEAESEGMKFGEASVYGEGKEDKAAKAKKDAKAKADKEAKAKKDKNVDESRKTPADLMREYVEKVGQDWGKNNPSEGDPVGSGGTKSPINSKSTQISGKNDMGGTTKNIAQGGTACDKDSNTGPKKPSNAYTKGEKKMGQDKYENSPAANTKGYKDKQTAKTKEGADTAGTQPVAKKSFNPGGKSGF